MAFTTVTGSNGVTSLVGTSGIDVATIVTLNANVFVGAQAADDTITEALSGPVFTASNWSVNGGAGNDTIVFNSNVLNSTINGDGGTGTAGNDIIRAFNTVINSAINGGSGNDVISNGGFGIDYSNATVNGNAGDDSIDIDTASASTFYGGQDVDTIRILGNSSSVVVNGNKGSDSITAAGGTLTSSTLFGGNGNDTITAAGVTVASATTAGVTIFGDLANDAITGSGGVDTISGGDGADALTAGVGADIVGGDAGDDSLTGNAGADVLTGGAGNDLFTYAALDATVSGNTGFDTITDFSAASSTVPVNGDQINIVGAAAQVASSIGASVASDFAGSLQAILEAADGNFTATAGEFFVITITAGASNAGIAGNYLVSNDDATAGYLNTADNVIKLNTLSGVLAGTSII